MSNAKRNYEAKGLLFNEIYCKINKRSPEHIVLAFIPINMQMFNHIPD